MNDDHQHNLLDYAQVLAGCDWAETAVMTGLDEHGFSMQVNGNGRHETHRIDFPEPVFDANGLRKVMVALAQQAAQQTPASDGIRRTATARVETTKATRYLKALCNHFAHKVTASYDDTNGRVQFPFGDCQFQAEPDALHITVVAESDTMLARTKAVVADHVVRFGNKETLRVFWSEDESDDS